LLVGEVARRGTRFFQGQGPGCCQSACRGAKHSFVAIDIQGLCAEKIELPSIIRFHEAFLTSTIEIPIMSPLKMSSARVLSSNLLLILSRCPACKAKLPIRTSRRCFSVSSKRPQQFSPSMEKIRAPFSHKNKSTLYEHPASSIATL